MGLRCLLGHEYANREVEREREERGNEVVVTYRTVETCERCGERRTVSENKEVRPVRNPAEDEVSTGLGGGVTPDLAGDDEAETPAPEAESAPAPEAESDPEPDAADPESATDDVDDAIILDDGPSEERTPGEWPDADAEETADEPEQSPEPDAVDDGATVVSGGDDWPTPEGEDEGFDAEASDGEPADVEFGGGLAPEKAPAGAAGEATADATNGQATGKQFVAAETVERVGDDRHDGETEFFCPNCGYSRTSGGSSMRAGDICPDCHQGYIAEREQ